MPRLDLFYLGPPRIERDQQPVDIRLAKANALLAYLALTAHPCSREGLTTLLWPEKDSAHARSSLRSILLVLNQTLGRAWLNANRYSVQLNENANIWLDIAHFDACLETCRSHGHPETEVCPLCLPQLTKAVDLYRGAFLEGFTLRDSLPFDEWQFFQSDRLRRAQISALARLTRGHIELESGNLDEALAYARRWVALDPLSELAHQHLMRIYAHSGLRTEALHQFQVCEQTLKRELGVRPSDATTALYQMIIEEGTLSRFLTPVPLHPLHNVQERDGVSKNGLETKIQAQSSRMTGSNHHLPAQLTSFIGRVKERAEIKSLLLEQANCRLITLIGPGGIGKTRLALQVAEDVADSFQHGVFYVSLESMDYPELLLPTILSALGFPSTETHKGIAQIPHDLHRKQLLIVLDHFEHLLESADTLIDVLHAMPNMKILVTSQEPLSLQGEWLIKVTGLEVPNGNSLEHVEHYSAVQVFVQSAKRVKPDFTPKNGDWQWITRICRMVDGMPLGLELAATWVRMLSCKEIASGIESNLEFLTTSLRNVPERHRSIQAVFDHSWNLLTAEERCVYKQLSVFVGGFCKEAAEEVAGASLAILLSLLDRGLLRRYPCGRYDRHPLLWLYAHNELNSTPAERDAVHTRHCAYYTTLLQRVASQISHRASGDAMDMLEAELENIRAAWHWGSTPQDASAIQTTLSQLVIALEPFTQAIPLNEKHLKQRAMRTVTALKTLLDECGNQHTSLNAQKANAMHQRKCIASEKSPVIK